MNLSKIFLEGSLVTLSNVYFLNRGKEQVPFFTNSDIGTLVLPVSGQASLAELWEEETGSIFNNYVNTYSIESIVFTSSASIKVYHGREGFDKELTTLSGESIINNDFLSNTTTEDITNDNALDLSFYRLFSISGNVVITGNFFDEQGRLTGDYFTYTLTDSAYHTLAQVAGGTIPSNSRTVLIKEVLGDICVTTSRADGTTGTFANAKQRAGIIPSGSKNIRLGETN